MGGAALAPGGITPVAEANIWHDSEAAAVVLAADWDVTLVPLVVTMARVLEESHRQALLASPARVPRALGEMLDYYFRLSERIDGPALLRDARSSGRDARRWRCLNELWHRWCAAVDTFDGPGRGKTACDMRGL